MVEDLPTKEEILQKWSEIFRAIGDSARLAILITLYGSEFIYKDAPCLTYSQIREITKFPSRKTLDHHLNVLLGNGLVRKVIYKDEKGRGYSLHQITEKGMEFLKDVGLSEVIRKFVIPRKTCSKCGKALKPDFKVCPYCGESLESYLLSE